LEGEIKTSERKAHAARIADYVALEELTYIDEPFFWVPARVFWACNNAADCAL
jgi:hypothetical protein